MSDLFADNSSDFASRADLAERCIRFCIDSADLVTQKSDGKVRWWLKIHYLDDTRGVVMKTLTFDQGTGKRDENFRHLMNNSNELPQHDVFLESVPLKGGKNFYALNQDREHGHCSCMTPMKADEVADDDKPESPF